MRRIFSPLVGMAAVFVLVAALTACSSGGGSEKKSASTQGGTGSPPGGSDVGTSVQIDAGNVNYVGKFTLSPEHGAIGSAVKARGTGFDANVPLQIVSQGYTGKWNTDAEKYLGREFTEELQPLTQVKTDSSGAFEATITVPEGFGFLHDVRVLQDKDLRNKSAFYVDMQVAMATNSGSVGTPITIEANGIGWRPLESSWDIIYDNQFTGWMSAVSTNGHATVTIPATGSPGKHVIRIVHGSFTFPYMNMQQSPDPGRPTWTFEFTITKGAPVLPQAGDKQGMQRQTMSAPAARGPAMWTDWQNGPVGSPVTL